MVEKGFTGMSALLRYECADLTRSTCSTVCIAGWRRHEFQMQIMVKSWWNHGEILGCPTWNFRWHDDTDSLLAAARTNHQNDVLYKHHETMVPCLQAWLTRDTSWQINTNYASIEMWSNGQNSLNCKENIENCSADCAVSLSFMHWAFPFWAPGAPYRKCQPSEPAVSASCWA